ncbi:MAG TPA: alpha/beta fold hydrolase [Actinomycetota bacterium]|nr:alpha/beta fold hydrolase [Actinomycetota bacterium]
MRSDMGGVGIEFDVHGSGRPVVLLHGFPDTGRLWRNQVPALVDAGFQVIVPDLRGYGRSGKPEDVDAYGIPFMLQDVSGILAAVGAPRAHIVGHDWGAALAWAFAHLAPDQVDHLVAMSVGTPGAFAKAGFAQREKSWYMLLFQFAGIAEQWLSSNNWANMREWGGHPDHDAVVGELEASGSLTPGLNWYRANVPPEVLIEGFPDLPPVQAPTMGLWSTGDRFLTEAPMVDSGAYVVGPWRYERVEGASHWMQLDRPDVINRLLIDFLPA